MYHLAMLNIKGGQGGKALIETIKDDEQDLRAWERSVCLCVCVTDSKRDSAKTLKWKPRAARPRIRPLCFYVWRETGRVKEGAADPV